VEHDLHGEAEHEQDPEATIFQEGEGDVSQWPDVGAVLL